MDPRSVRVLEYPQIIERLADQAATSLGRRRCQELRPSTDRQWITQRLTETSEARWLLERNPPSFGGITDVRALLQKSQVGSLLETAELLVIRDLAEACQRLLHYFDQCAQNVPNIAELGLRLRDYPELQESITRCVSDDAEIKTDASHHLATLHARAQTLYRRVQERMNSLIEQYRHRGVLQDLLVVQRAGRWCLPVQSQFQSRVKGIVHDRSDSGATVFVEPLDVVDLGNELRETELAIEEEKRRILQELTSLVATRADDLAQDLQRISVLDFIFAKGRLSLAQNAVEPQITPEQGYLNLNGARHPLLGAEVVPIDFWIGEDFTTLVITGPNTGGKTVSLKTIGLLTLMAQSGLHVPAEPGTVLPVLDAIYADIGDEQSIEQSLSSFSSHMTQIIKIVSRVSAAQRQARPMNALVLLDEIGAGTDPSEGAALAMSLLEWLHQAGCRTVVTTHYNELKAFAYSREGMENASVEFDVHTLAPTYHLEIGAAGSSNAFEIAQRLGLAAELTTRGRELLSGESRDFVRALEHVERTQRELHAERTQARQTQQELQRLRERYKRDVADLEQRRQEAIAEGFDDAQKIVAEARARADEIIRQLQEQAEHTAESEELRGQLKAAEAELAAVQEQFDREQQRAAEQEKAARIQLAPVEEVSRGDRVYAPAFDREAVVREVLDEETALIQIGSISIEVNIANLRQPPQKPDLPSPPPAPEQRVQVRKQLNVPDEIEVRGMTVDEALAALDKYLDDAILAGRERVRIIHGKGTGVLRQAVHVYLHQHPAVRDFQIADRAAGGEGATEVDLSGD